MGKTILYEHFAMKQMAQIRDPTAQLHVEPWILAKMRRASSLSPEVSLLGTFLLMNPSNALPMDHPRDL
jgi:hypothetical protein